MTTEQIACLPSHELRAIIRSTNPAGQYWLEYQMARDELARRESDHARRVCRVAKLIDRMIRRGEPADTIATAVGVKEHFILARMKELADRESRHQ